MIRALELLETSPELSGTAQDRLLRAAQERPRLFVWPTGLLVQPIGLLFLPTGLMFWPTRLLFRPTGLLFWPIELLLIV